MTVQLGLGTVQFGLPYGISNSHGQVPLPMVQAILATARQYKLQILDTAYLYGEAEQRLGECELSAFQVISKSPELQSSSHARQCLTESLTRLRLSNIDSLLLHRPNQLWQAFGEDLWQQLQAFKHEGLVRRIGVSVYTPSELTALLDQFPLDLVQLPANLFDQRFLQSGLLQRCQQQGVAVHVRSLFLQGLLLMPEPPGWTHPYQSVFQQLEQSCQSFECSRLQACLGFLQSLPAVEAGIIGCTSDVELAEICAAFAHPPSIEFPYQDFSQSDDNLISPMRWPRE